MENVYTVTLNPAIDRVLYLDEFVPAITNRLTDTAEGLGGKGTHVSLNLKLLGLESTALGFIRGDAGKRIEALLCDAGVASAFTALPGGETRTNYLIIEKSGRSTCLSEKGIELKSAELDAFMDELEATLQEDDWLILSGDASNCADPAIYNRIIDRLSTKAVKFVIDASGATLKRCIESHPYLIKPNRDELEHLAGRALESEDDLRSALRALAIYDIPIIAVSLGGEGSLVQAEGELFRVYPPEVSVVNTIGCGDCFLAGLVFGIHEGYDIEEALRIATAASAATAESPLSVGFDLKRYWELRERVRVLRVGA